MGVDAIYDAGNSISIRGRLGPDWGSYHSFFVDYELYRDGIYQHAEPGYWLNGIVNITAIVISFHIFIAMLTMG